MANKSLGFWKGYAIALSWAVVILSIIFGGLGYYFTHFGVSYV